MYLTCTGKFWGFMLFCFQNVSDWWNNHTVRHLPFANLRFYTWTSDIFSRIVLGWFQKEETAGKSVLQRPKLAMWFRWESCLGRARRRQHTWCYFDYWLYILQIRTKTPNYPSTFSEVRLQLKDCLISSDVSTVTWISWVHALLGTSKQPPFVFLSKIVDVYDPQPSLWSSYFPLAW